MNEHEEKARQVKANDIATLLQGWGYRSYNVAAWEQTQWKFATDAANEERRLKAVREGRDHTTVRKMDVPSEKTRGLVIEMLVDRERAAVPQHTGR